MHADSLCLSLHSAMDFTSGRRELDEMDAREMEKAEEKEESRRGWKKWAAAVFDKLF
jgi:hypothetical protein